MYFFFKIDKQAIKPISSCIMAIVMMVELEITVI